jgi:8-oxo-dGTP pyrophosphatase MutT (NUDIX family)
MKARVLSAGVVVVRWVEGVPHYLLLRAYSYWDFPKGKLEPGEDPLQAAKREVEEETTLVGLSFRWGHKYRETPPYGRGKVARYYVAESRRGEVSLPINPELGRAEHHEYRWLEYRAARERLVDRLRPILDWANALIVPEGS